jgi:hypothetical protein
MQKLRFGLLLVLACTCALLAVGAATASSPVVGHLYVNDNTTGMNTIGAFDRHVDGTLTPMPGSPFVAGGAGTGTGLASQGRCNGAATVATCWPSMPGATRSLCCGSGTTAP